jgi:hypothetical protein
VSGEAAVLLDRVGRSASRPATPSSFSSEERSSPARSPCLPPNGAFVAGTQSGADLDTVTLYLDGASEASGVWGAIDTINGIILASENAIQQEMEAAYLLVYDRALSAAEVEQNRQALKAILSARGISLP